MKIEKISERQIRCTLNKKDLVVQIEFVFAHVE